MGKAVGVSDAAIGVKGSCASASDAPGKDGDQMPTSGNFRVRPARPKHVGLKSAMAASSEHVARWISPETEVCELRLGLFLRFSRATQFYKSTK